MDLNNLLENIYDDISFSESELDNLKESTNKFIENELDKINKYLKKSVIDFTKKEIENLKKNKIDLLHKNINTITESVLIKVSEEYDLDKDEVLQNNKPNLLEINNFNTLYSNDNSDKILDLYDTTNEEESIDNNIIQTDNKSEESKESEESEESKKFEEKSRKTFTKNKKPVKLDSTTENDAYKNHLIQQKKCPVFKGGKYCEKTAKHGHYCGYHKKFDT